MLTNYSSPKSNDTDFQRFRGYERFSSAVYKELVTSIRAFKNKNISGRSKIEMSPYAVWQNIMQDQSLKLVEEINPIQNLKEDEIVTYVGQGGRDKGSMTSEARETHWKDIGTISEANIDSGDVGINAYLSANPNFSNLRGFVKKEKELNNTAMFSTSALISPGSLNDSSSRTSFISIQQGHTIAAEGYRQPYVRTGYEYIISRRNSDLFAYMARKDGEVISIDDHGIIVKYNDGEQVGVNLGRRFGKAEGSVYPHDVITDMKVGQKFKEGAPIAYNSGFFERDILDPNQIIMKASTPVTVALMETNETFEDSSGISLEYAERLKTKSTKIKKFLVGFNQNLRNVVKVGQKITPKDIIMTIEDEITSLGQYGEDSLAALKDMSNNSSYSEYYGTVDRIDVYYHGEKSEMSPTLKALADKSDRLFIQEKKSIGEAPIDGSVNSEWRSDGTPLSLNMAEIVVSITTEVGMGIADKHVLCHQLKTTVGRVYQMPIYSEKGIKVDAIFSRLKIAARVVTSADIIGTTVPLLQRAKDIFLELADK